MFIKKAKFRGNLCTWRIELVTTRFRSSHPEVFFRKRVLKICSKFTGEHPCRNVIWIKLQSNFIEIALRHGCSSVNLLDSLGILIKICWIVSERLILGTPLGGCFGKFSHILTLGLLLRNVCFQASIYRKFQGVYKITIPRRNKWILKRWSVIGE